MISRRSQSAVEFMMIVGIAFTLMIPSLFLFQQFSAQSSERIISGQINSFGREMISAVESMYYYGESSKVKVAFNAPEKIQDMYINAGGEGLNEFVITARLYGGETDFVFFTDVPISPEGNMEWSSDLSGGIEPREDAFMSGRMQFSIETVEKDSLKVRIKRLRGE
ncbi:MAG: hypothetical protein ACLFTR_02845 [Candidatus Woesearchaeota archaeon]